VGAAVGIEPLFAGKRITLGYMYIDDGIAAADGVPVFFIFIAAECAALELQSAEPEQCGAQMV
jgi:hypothetical protein